MDERWLDAGLGIGLVVFGIPFVLIMMYFEWKGSLKPTIIARDPNCKHPDNEALKRERKRKLILEILHENRSESDGNNVK